MEIPCKRLLDLWIPYRTKQTQKTKKFTDIWTDKQEGKFFFIRNKNLHE